MFPARTCRGPRGRVSRRLLSRTMTRDRATSGDRLDPAPLSQDALRKLRVVLGTATTRRSPMRASMSCWDRRGVKRAGAPAPVPSGCARWNVEAKDVPGDRRSSIRASAAAIGHVDAGTDGRTCRVAMTERSGSAEGNRQALPEADRTGSDVPDGDRGRQPGPRSAPTRALRWARAVGGLDGPPRLAALPGC